MVAQKTPADAGETMTFKLAVPLKYEGKVFSEITLREPEVGDVISAEKFSGQAEQTVALFAAMSGLPIGAIRSMKIRDFRRIERWAAPFIGASSSEAEDGAT